MRVAYNVCDRPRCRRKAVAAYDVRPAWRQVDGETRHYEVCEQHEREFFRRGEGFVSAEQSERIRTLLRSSDGGTA